MSIYSQYAEANVALQGALDALKARSEKLNQLIAEARGILESSGVVDAITGGAHVVESEFVRLREILDELERLP